MNQKIKQIVASTALVMAIGGGAIALYQAPARADGTVPAELQKGIDDSKAAVGALSGLAIVCLTVALVPLGSMLTLRFLNMVLSRV